MVTTGSNWGSVFCWSALVGERVKGPYALLAGLPPAMDRAKRALSAAGSALQRGLCYVRVVALNWPPAPVNIAQYAINTIARDGHCALPRKSLQFPARVLPFHRSRSSSVRWFFVHCLSLPTCRSLPTGWSRHVRVVPSGYRTQ